MFMLQEFLAQQDQVKNEPLEIVYSYWDGSGHRRKVRIELGCRHRGYYCHVGGWDLRYLLSCDKASAHQQGMNQWRH
jgi:hypothetical protein